MPYIDDRIIGNQGFIYYDPEEGPQDPLEIIPPPSSQNTLKPQFIPITSWMLNIDKYHVDITNSTNWDSEEEGYGTKLIY